MFKIAKARQVKQGPGENNNYDWDRWRRSRNKVTILAKQLKSKRMCKDAQLLVEKKHAPHKYHSILKHMTGRSKSVRIPPLQNNNGDLVTDDKANAELLNQYFPAQIELANSENSDLPYIQRDDAPQLNMTTITEREVLKVINSLNQNKSTGHRRDSSNIYQANRSHYSWTSLPTLQQINSGGNIPKRLESSNRKINI